MNSNKVINQLDALKAAVRANPSSIGVIGPQIRDMVSAVSRLPGSIAAPGGTTGVVCIGHCNQHCVAHPSNDFTIQTSNPA